MGTPSDELLVRSGRHTLLRRDVTQQEPVPVPLPPTVLQAGRLEQANVLDQFAAAFKPLIARYHAPASACGYFSVANAIVLARQLPARGRTATRAEVEGALAALRDAQLVTAEVERMMAFVHDARQAYTAAHSGLFDGAEATAKYLSDWVANYEISDYLREQASKGLLPASVCFLRYNQLAEIGDARHEELQRLEEERPFGGPVPGGGISKQTCQLEAGATRFILERFLPSRVLQRPGEWAAAEVDGGAGPPVLIVDVDGHFVVATAMLEEERAADSSPRAGAADVSVLLVINTTASSYLGRPAIAYAFDLLFGLQSR